MIEIGWICQTRQQLYYYWRCCQHLSPFHPIPLSYFFFFVSFIQSRARKIQMSFFNVESIGSIFIVFKRMRDRHCVNIAHVSVSRKSRFPLPPCSLYWPKVRRRHMKKLFLWTFVRHFKWCICCNQINLLRNCMVKGMEVEGLFFKCELENMFLCA